LKRAALPSCLKAGFHEDPKRKSCPSLGEPSSATGTSWQFRAAAARNRPRRPPPPPPPAPPAWRSAATIMALFALALLWACLGHVDIVATATGKIIPTVYSKVIQPFETGSGRHRRVADGQVVHAGDVLIELDPTSMKGETISISRVTCSPRARRRPLATRWPTTDEPSSSEFHPGSRPTPALVAMHRSCWLRRPASSNAKIAALTARRPKRRPSSAPSRPPSTSSELCHSDHPGTSPISAQFAPMNTGSRLQSSRCFPAIGPRASRQRLGQISHYPKRRRRRRHIEPGRSPDTSIADPVGRA